MHGCTAVMQAIKFVYATLAYMKITMNVSRSLSDLVISNDGKSCEQLVYTMDAYNVVANLFELLNDFFYWKIIRIERRTATR